MAKVKELISKEKEIYSEINRKSIHLSSLRNQLKSVIKSHHLDARTAREAHHFQQLFAYYQHDLIPALEETIRLGQRHIELAIKNPDSAFKPFKVEAQNHLKIARQFFIRLNQVEKEFDNFCAFM